MLQSTMQSIQILCLKLATPVISSSENNYRHTYEIRVTAPKQRANNTPCVAPANVKMSQSVKRPLNVKKCQR